MDIQLPKLPIGIDSLRGMKREDMKPDDDDAFTWYVPPSDLYNVEFKSAPMFWDLIVADYAGMRTALAMLNRLVIFYLIGTKDSGSLNTCYKNPRMIEKFRRLLELAKPLLDELEPLYQEQLKKEEQHKTFMNLEELFRKLSKVPPADETV
jgi:hypothetical protein